MNVLGGMLTQCFIAKITTGKSAETKHHFCRRDAVIEVDVQPLEREELDPYRLKLPPLHRNIVLVSELVMPTGNGGKCPHTTDGTIGYKLG